MTSTYNKQKNLLITIILSTLLVFTSGVSYYIYKTQHYYIAHEEQNIVEAEVELIGEFLVDMLIRHDYAEAKNFLRAWTLKNEALAVLNVKINHKYHLFEYTKGTSSDIVFKKTFNVEGVDFTIDLGHTLKKADVMLNNLKYMLAAFSVVLTAVIGAGLWLILSKWVLKPMNEEIVRQTKELTLYSNKLEKLNRMYAKLSVTDQLTGIFNRRKIDETLQYELERAKRYSTPLSLIMLDIDHFKQVNDTYGHGTGDTVLKEFTNILSDNRRNTDVLGRWGGEEFMLILPETTLENARTLAERIRRRAESHDFPTVGKKTCSLGVVEFKPEDDAVSLVNRVDAALYSAKNSGRNKVVS